MLHVPLTVTAAIQHKVPSTKHVLGIATGVQAKRWTPLHGLLLGSVMGDT